MNEPSKLAPKVKEYNLHEESWCITGVAKQKQALMKQGLSYGQAIHVLQVTSKLLAEERDRIKMSVISSDDNVRDEKTTDWVDSIKRSEVKTRVEIKHKALILRIKQFMQRLLNQ